MQSDTLHPSLDMLALNGPTEAAASASDEQLALRAREHYKESGVPEVAADDTIAPLLDRQERVLGGPDMAILRRVDVEEDTRAVLREEGPLYVTDHRLVHIGNHVESISLLDIDELAMADDRILVTLVGSRGLTLDVETPQQLRVLIAAAKAARRLQAEG